MQRKSVPKEEEEMQGLQKEMQKGKKEKIVQKQKVQKEKERKEKSTCIRWKIHVSDFEAILLARF